MFQHLRLFKYLLAMLVIPTLAGCQSSSAAPVSGLLLDSPYLIDEFILTDQFNNQVSSTEFRGSFVLVYFGFTNCPDECPTTLSIWKKVDSLLKQRGQSVEFVMISVDPVRDTPEQLLTYLANFNPTFIGLTGAIPQIEDIASDFSAFFRNVYPDEFATPEHEDDHNNSQEYLVAHTTLTFLLDAEGRIVLAFPYNTSAQDIVTDLEGYLE